MSAFPIDDYAYASRLRSVHPAEKMLFAGSTIAICLAAGSPLVAAASFILVSAVVNRLAGLPLGVFGRFLMLPVGFIVLSVMTMAVIVLPADPGSWAALSIGSWRIGVTESSLAQAGRTLAVSLASVSATLGLILTTPLVDIIDQLRRWHAPVLLVELMILVYRFLFVLLDTAHSIYQAQEARLGYRTLARSYRSLGQLTSALYLHSQARAYALVWALTARGYSGQLRMLIEQPTWSRRNLAAIGVTQAALLTLAVVQKLGGLP